MPPPTPIETQPKLEFVQLSRDGDFALFEQAGKDGLKVNRREYSLLVRGVKALQKVVKMGQLDDMPYPKVKFGEPIILKETTAATRYGGQRLKVQVLLQSDNSKSLWARVFYPPAKDDSRFPMSPGKPRILPTKQGCRFGLFDAFCNFDKLPITTLDADEYVVEDQSLEELEASLLTNEIEAE